ncbi:MAG: ring-cleaving dioxygenase [Microscillaceae bacterium]|nr:ring-cleaving dioxygenase [Microscillaceae bacterium]
MSQLINGLHHVTALVGDPQQNVNFYAGILGLRLVKKTINFDAPDVYHLYYGDEAGNPGTIMTFFPYPGLPRGHRGTGQLTYTSFSIAEDALDYWMERLKKYNIPFQGPVDRLEESALIFEDFDGLGLELVANTKDNRQGWSNGKIPQEYAVKGFYTVALSEEGYERTAGLLTETLQHRLVFEKGNRFRYEAGVGGPGNYVDVLCEPDAVRARPGSGTVHHVAFSTSNSQTQLDIREKIAKLGYNPTPVLDRNYFTSIYFREPGHILFEVATNPPGFTADESLTSLGQALKLPSWQEENRALIEAGLSPIVLPDFE